MAFEHLADLPADRQHRIEAGCRLLKDHCDPSATPGAHLRLGQAQQVAAVHRHLPAQYPPGGRQQAEDALRAGGLAAARFSEQGKGFAAGDAE